MDIGLPSRKINKTDIIQKDITCLGIGGECNYLVLVRTDILKCLFSEISSCTLSICSSFFWYFKEWWFWICFSSWIVCISSTTIFHSFVLASFVFEVFWKLSFESNALKSWLQTTCRSVSVDYSPPLRIMGLGQTLGKTLSSVPSCLSPWACQRTGGRKMKLKSKYANFQLILLISAWNPYLHLRLSALSKDTLYYVFQRINLYSCLSAGHAHFLGYVK